MPIDYKRYPPDWKKTRERILIRAKNSCEICGLENRALVWSVTYYMRHCGVYSFRTIWFSKKSDAKRECLGNKIKVRFVVLTISHLDHDETNHNVQDNRLKALCQVCHLRYDAVEKNRRIMEKFRKKNREL